MSSSPAASEWRGSPYCTSKPRRNGASGCHHRAEPARPWTRTMRLRTEDRTPRAGEEAGLDEQRHRNRLDDRLAVEPLHRQALAAGAADMRNEGRERDAQPLLLGLAQRDERAAAALDEEGRLAAEQHDVGARDARGAGAAAPRPRQRGSVRLCGVGGGEDERLRLLPVLRPELAQTLDGAAERELRTAEAFDEVAAAARPERLECA